MYGVAEFTVNLATVWALVGLVVGLFKPFVELIPGLGPGKPLHDSAIQIFAMVIGVIVSMLFLWAAGPINRTDALQLATSVVLGLAGGSASIGTYHVGKAAGNATKGPQK